MKDYSEKGKIVEYKFLQIHFKGEIEFFATEIQKYKIKVNAWIGKGYPHLYRFERIKDLKFIHQIRKER